VVCDSVHMCVYVCALSTQSLRAHPLPHTFTPDRLDLLSPASWVDTLMAQKTRNHLTQHNF